jgi:hypothetical protein
LLNGFEPVVHDDQGFTSRALLATIFCTSFDESGELSIDAPMVIHCRHPPTHTLAFCHQLGLLRAMGLGFARLRNQRPPVSLPHEKDRAIDS